MKKITDEKTPSKEAFEETEISLEDTLVNQETEETDELPNFIKDNITLEEPLTYSRKH